MHNDTKLNNLLLDEHTGEPLCVIDLDTVMPGFALHDFGDLVRTGAARATEDERDLAKVGVDESLYEALVRGLPFLRGALPDARRRRSTSPWAPRSSCSRIALRFLTDHLEGDVYFRIHRPGHNLDRCRTQLAFFHDLEERGDRSAPPHRGAGRGGRSMSHFSLAIDGSIVGLYLLATMVAGLMVRKYVGGVEDFLVAGREMDVHLGIASLAATEFGIVTCMYTAEGGYRYGFAGATPGILMALAMFVVGVTGFCVKPLRDAGVMTLPELFEKQLRPRRAPRLGRRHRPGRPAQHGRLPAHRRRVPDDRHRPRSRRRGGGRGLLGRAATCSRSP